MEEYKRDLFAYIYDCRDETIEQVEKRISNKTRFIINRNEEGKIHSRYLVDRYEPAIIKQDYNYTVYYYLFDGDIKDCIHPFRVIYYCGNIISIMYYSSERIKNGEPIYIDRFSSYYNIANNEILSEYESKIVYELNNLKAFTLVCDEMEELFPFKFAD